MSRRVAIIGAGVAGLRLGSLLQARGLGVTLFDKARGPAGRIATRRLEPGQFDHGAQYFTARSQPFALAVEDWLDRGVVAPWPARVARLDRGQVEAESSPPVRYVGVPSMSAIARDLAHGLDVRTGTRIAEVRPAGARWILVADDGFESEAFDWVVSAVPAPQAPALLTGSTKLMQQAQSVSFLACHAAMIRFASPLEVDFDAAFVDRSPLGWLARQASKPRRDPSDDWVLHSTPAWSEANLELAPERALVMLCDALTEALARPLPALRSGITHRWLFARARKPLAGSPLWDGARGLGVCGDWVQGDRLEDAFLSADRLVEAMEGGSALADVAERA